MEFIENKIFYEITVGDSASQAFALSPTHPEAALGRSHR